MHVKEWLLSLLAAVIRCVASRRRLIAKAGAMPKAAKDSGRSWGAVFDALERRRLEQMSGTGSKLGRPVTKRAIQSQAAVAETLDTIHEIVPQAGHRARRSEIEELRCVVGRNRTSVELIAATSLDESSTTIDKNDY